MKTEGGQQNSLGFWSVGEYILRVVENREAKHKMQTVSIAQIWFQLTSPLTPPS